MTGDAANARDAYLLWLLTPRGSMEAQLVFSDRDEEPTIGRSVRDRIAVRIRLPDDAATQPLSVISQRFPPNYR